MTEPSEKSLQRARKVLDDWNAGWSWVDGQVQDQLLAENQRMAALIAAAIDEAVREEREAIIALLHEGRQGYLDAAELTTNYAAAGGLRIAADVLEGWINGIRDEE